FGATQNPVGLLVSGYITSPGVALINDFSSSCANYQCGSPIMPEGNHTGTFGLGENQIIAVNALFQSIPNPSNGETTIGYNISDMKVSAYIAVYNISGEQVKRFDVNTTGRGKIVFDATDIKAGYYSYRLVVDGGDIDTKKLIVTK
ncbi:MAG: T9SS type A sorting domain-containing protein, partial [Flavipsychrobacter sp.]